MSVFQNRFKQLRIEHGLSQEEAAVRLGCSRSRVGMYETGKREPDFEMMEKIADLFNVDMSYLVGGSDYTIKVDNDMELILEVMRNPSTRELLVKYAELLKITKEEK